MIQRRYMRAFILAQVLAVGCTAHIAQAVEPDAPERIITRSDATLMTLRNKLNGRERERFGLNKADSDDLAAYYSDPSSRLIWVDDEGMNRNRLEQLHMAARRAAEFGLNPEDYALPKAERMAGISGYPAEWLAEKELKASATAMTYARHAQAGRLVPSSVHEYFDLKPEKPKATDVLAALAASDDLAAQLETYHPTHEQFAALKQQLALLRSGSQEPPPVAIPDGPSLGPGTSHPQIAILRQRLNVSATQGVDYYDEALADAVRTVQRKEGLQEDAIVGRNTRTALNKGAVKLDAATIISNMERWRWKRRDFGSRYIEINIPEFVFRVKKDGQVIHQERIVAGSPKHPTPIFSDLMETVVFNPYWYVPRSILENEILPAARNDPSYVSRNRMEVIWQGSRTVDPWQVDWYYVDPKKVALRQTPGTGNALGLVKFLFPNKHAVYMHDTPTKHLFEKPMRAYSHGCMRVRNPFDFAKLLLAEQGWGEREMQSALQRGNEQHVKLEKPIPVNILYFTAWIKDGEAHRYPDIYGHDASVKAALNLTRESNLLAVNEREFDAEEGGLQN